MSNRKYHSGLPPEAALALEELLAAVRAVVDRVADLESKARYDDLPKRPVAFS
jgi:hypothetical protein